MTTAVVELTAEVVEVVLVVDMAVDVDSTEAAFLIHETVWLNVGSEVPGG